jgi:hypothetical protein
MIFSTFHGKNLKLVYLMVYIKLVLTRLLKNLNNVELCRPIDVPSLNFDYEMDII